MMLLQSFVSVLFNLCLVSVKCELGQRGSNAFSDIGDGIEQFEWHLYREQIKQMLPIVLAMTQQPVLFKCFGSITCCRETFKKVSKRLIFKIVT